MKFILLSTLLLISTASLATPELIICFDGNCETKLNVKISNSAWSMVENIFSDKTISDQQERQCIAKAFAIIELDAFQTLSIKTNNELSAHQIHSRMNNKDEATNSKNIISLLMNNHLATRYYLRKTESRSSWFGFNELAIIMQARSNAKTYAVDSTKDGFGQEPNITPYNEWKTAKSYISLPKNTFKLINPPDTTFKKDD